MLTLNYIVLLKDSALNYTSHIDNEPTIETKSLSSYFTFSFFTVAALLFSEFSWSEKVKQWNTRMLTLNSRLLYKWKTSHFHINNQSNQLFLLLCPRCSHSQSQALKHKLKTPSHCHATRRFPHSSHHNLLPTPWSADSNPKWRPWLWGSLLRCWGSLCHSWPLQPSTNHNWRSMGSSWGNSWWTLLRD